MKPKKKLKIQIKDDHLTQMDRDIMKAGATKISKKEFKKKMKSIHTMSLSPQVAKQLAKLGITPEQLAEQINK